jgi:hypothetical protein
MAGELLFEWDLDSTWGDWMRLAVVVADDVALAHIDWLVRSLLLVGDPAHPDVSGVMFPSDLPKSARPAVLAVLDGLPPGPTVHEVRALEIYRRLQEEGLSPRQMARREEGRRLLRLLGKTWADQDEATTEMMTAAKHLRRFKDWPNGRLFWPGWKPRRRSKRASRNRPNKTQGRV